MLSVSDFRSGLPQEGSLGQALPRAGLDVQAAVEAITPTMEAVKAQGAKALRDLAERFDQVRPRDLRMRTHQLHQALQMLDPKVKSALELAIDHMRLGHRAQLPREIETQILPGGIIRQRWIPVQRVGLYVPGGLAVYPSSVVMNVMAAKVAGVKEIVVASPPQAQWSGQVHPTIMAACALLGIEEVYAVGGAQAIAMLAYGAKGETESDAKILCKPVDVITGPGNIYVAAAKRYVKSQCGIDAEAGPTEIAIIADESANPAYVAADLISQAEHDPQAAALLITTSADLAGQVQKEIEQQVQRTKHQQRITAALQGEQSGILLVADLNDAIKVANAYGAEHLEIQTARNDYVASQIHNAGAIFVGEYSPVPLGDYLAGSNHVLPTGGTARYSAGLSVMAYLKPVQEIRYTQEGLRSLAEPLAALALAEDLPAHSQSVNYRC